MVASLGMYDQRTVSKLADIVRAVLSARLGIPNLKIYKTLIKRRPGVNEHFRVNLTGRRAEAWAEELLPFIRDTDKEDKLLGELKGCGLELVDGKLIREHRPRVKYGMAHANCKVTDDQVKEIRRIMEKPRRRGDKAAKKLAERFRVTESLIHAIASGRSRARAS